MFAEKLLASVAKTDMMAAAANSRSDTEDLLFEQLVPVGMVSSNELASLVLVVSLYFILLS